MQFPRCFCRTVMLAKLRSFAAAALFRTLFRKLNSLTRLAVPLLPNTRLLLWLQLVIAVPGIIDKSHDHPLPHASDLAIQPVLKSSTHRTA